MIHFAIRSKSMRSGDRPFTTPGLGDRVHSALLAYVYGKKHNEKVTIHITKDKFDKPHKKQSWPEILDLFGDTLSLKVHECENLYEHQWIAYLKDKGYDAITYFYKDTMDMHPNDPPIPNRIDMVDISEYLDDYPRLTYNGDAKLLLPENFVTAQFEGGSDRVLNEDKVVQILNEYRMQGLEIVHIGKNAEHPDLKEIPYMAYAMSKAKYHVGIDSGMLHIATLYKQNEDIHLYHNGKFRSHHFVRGVRNGMKVNLYV